MFLFVVQFDEIQAGQNELFYMRNIFPDYDISLPPYHFCQKLQDFKKAFFISSTLAIMRFESSESRFKKISNLSNKFSIQ